MNPVSVVGWLVTAGGMLAWLDLLRPAPRRTLITDRPSVVLHGLLSAWVLVFWGSKLVGPPPGTKGVTDDVLTAVLAACLVGGFFVFRPVSGDFRRAMRLSRRGNLDGAEAAYRRVLSSGRQREVPHATLNIGRVLYRRGDLDGAGVAFLQAINAGRPDVVPAATLSLGFVLERQGDTEGARAAYSRAADHGPRRVRERAIRALTRLDEAQAEE